MALSKDEFEQKWKPLRKEVEDLSHTRNIFAHHPTLRIGTSKDGKPIDVYSIYIEPYERVLNNDYPGLRGKETLEIEDLKQHNQGAEALESKLNEFAWRMGLRFVERKIAEGRSQNAPS